MLDLLTFHGTTGVFIGGHAGKACTAGNNIFIGDTAGGDTVGGDR